MLCCCSLSSGWHKGGEHDGKEEKCLVANANNNYFLFRSILLFSVGGVCRISLASLMRSRRSRVMIIHSNGTGEVVEELGSICYSPRRGRVVGNMDATLLL